VQSYPISGQSQKSVGKSAQRKVDETTDVLQRGEFALHRPLNPGGGWGMLDPQTIEFALFAMKPTSGSDVRLTVAERNGIVAADNHEPWVGCTNLLLPFP